MKCVKEVPHVSRRTVYAERTWRASSFDEPSVHRTAAAPCLLYLRIHSRRNGMSPSAWALGRAAGLSKDPWGQSGGFPSDTHLLSEMFGKGPEDCSGALAGDWNNTMTPRAVVPHLPDESCLRCGGLLVASYSASLECDPPGMPVKLWRCINCGNCLDRCILANRLQSPMPARRRARRSRRGAGTGITW